MYRILVVEDCDDITRLLQLALQERRVPWHVDYVESVEEAVEKCRDNAYRIILTDWMFPGYTGSLVISEVRKYLGPAVPILIWSAYPPEKCSEMHSPHKVPVIEWGGSYPVGIQLRSADEGVLCFLQKPTGDDFGRFLDFLQEIVESDIVGFLEKLK